MVRMDASSVRHSRARSHGDGQRFSREGASWSQTGGPGGDARQILRQAHQGLGLLALLDGAAPVLDGAGGPEAQAAAVREALERQLWADLTRGMPGWDAAGVAVLAGRATGLALRLLPPTAAAHLPAAAARRWEGLAALPDDAPDAAWLAARTGQGGLPVAWRDCLRLARPLEDLLMGDGDSRLHPGADGYSPYGLDTRPVAGVCFAATTATPVDAIAFKRAAAVRRRLIALTLTQGYTAALRLLAREQRQTLLALCDVATAEGAQAILAPSGTHAAMLPLFFQPDLYRSGPPLTVILVGAVETGRGVPNAVAGLIFDPIAVGGGGQAVGQPIDPALAGRVRVCDVPLRDGAGAVRPADDVAQDITRLIADAVGAGGRALLYAVAASKTGLSQPGDDLLDGLRRQWGAALDIVVDACQWRGGAAAPAHHLAAGRMVMVTGSKFATALPFCGALLLPRAVAARVEQGLAPLPAGLAAHSARPYWPDQWDAFTQALPADPAPGTLLRWETGLAHLDPYVALPASQRREVEDALAAALARVIDESGHCRLIPGAGCAGVLPFTVHRADGSGLDMAALKALYFAVQRGGGVGGGDAPGAAAFPACHIGQPVALSADGALAALRVAVDARHVTAVAARLGAGDDLRDAVAAIAARLAAILTVVARVRERLDL